MPDASGLIITQLNPSPDLWQNTPSPEMHQITYYKSTPG